MKRPEPLAVTAITACCAIGHGAVGMAAGLRAGRSGLRADDFDPGGAGWIGRIDGLEQHRLPARLAAFDCRNNRLADVALHTDGFDAAVAAAARRYGADRVALVLGTSTSGVLSCEEAYTRRGPAGDLPADFNYACTQDMFSSARYLRAVLGLRGPAMVVSTACASSAKTFIEAQHLLAARLCDAVVVGGTDTLCRLTLRGFHALALISPTPSRPCDAGRSGISIGEGAGFALLERDGGPLLLLGAGATSDGYHMSAPHPEGAGAVGAMQAALRCSGLGPADVDYVNLHGTGTRANDAMEDAAVTAVFGAAMACSSSKGGSGHTLGASGIVGAMVAALAIQQGFMPGCIGLEIADPSFQAHVLPATQTRPVHRAMVNSFGFGGINCSLLFGAA